MIYRDDILPASETFIAAQARCMREFEPLLVGSRRVEGLDIGSIPTYTIRDRSNGARRNELAFKFLGRVPRVLDAKIRSFSPVLIHAHFGIDGAFALPLARRYGLPLVVTYHGYDATTSTLSALCASWRQRLYVARRGTLKRGATRIIAVSQYIKRTLVEQGFPEEKILVHYIGIDRHFFTPVPATRKPVVLFVGRCVEKKGGRYLIAAMEEVQHEHPEFELVVIGDGPLRDEWHTEAGNRLRRFRFLGAQPPEIVRNWMNEATIFCVPSVVAESGDAEGFGLVFAEAQAMGVPVVSFASGGVPEAVEHGATGFLAAPKDAHQLAHYIKALISEPKLWQTFSESGRLRVRDSFSLDHQTALLEEIYAETLRESLPS